MASLVQLSISICSFLVVVLVSFHQVTAECVCNDKSLCLIVTEEYKHQVFIFSLNQSNFQSYDYTRVTTIAFTRYDLDPQLVCLAHARKTRVVPLRNFPVANLTHPETFQPWIDNEIKNIIENHYDGINVDFEDAIPKDEVQTRDGYTKLISMLSTQLKSISKYYEISIDFAWSPNCIDDRCYDYAALSNVVDVAFIMSYDERSQFAKPCTAWANSPFNMTTQGVEDFLKLGIPAQKLVLGVPWYGYKYPCINYDAKNVCSIKAVPYHGSECSDAAGRQVNYANIWSDNMYANSSTGRLWDETAKSPYFTYKDSTGQLYQMWYDDARSLSFKYNFALLEGLGGVGMWQADAIDYANTSQIMDTWGTIPWHRDSQHRGAMHKAAMPANVVQQL